MFYLHDLKWLKCMNAHKLLWAFPVYYMFNDVWCTPNVYVRVLTKMFCFPLFIRNYVSFGSITTCLLTACAVTYLPSWSILQFTVCSYIFSSFSFSAFFSDHDAILRHCMKRLESRVAFYLSYLCPLWYISLKTENARFMLYLFNKVCCSYNI